MSLIVAGLVGGTPPAYPEGLAPTAFTINCGLDGGADIDGHHPDNGGDIRKNLGHGSDAVVLQVVEEDFKAGSKSATPVISAVDCGNVGDEVGNSWLPRFCYGTPGTPGNFKDLFATVKKGDVVILDFAMYGRSTGIVPDIFPTFIEHVLKFHDAIISVATTVFSAYLGVQLPNPTQTPLGNLDVENRLLNDLDNGLRDHSDSTLVGTVHAVVRWPSDASAPSVDITPGFNAALQQKYFDSSTDQRQRYFLTSGSAIYEPVVRLNLVAQ